jgi:hypothetical protein
LTQAAAEGSCYGISINAAGYKPEWFRNLVIRGNTISNLGGCSICLSAVPGVVVENNVIVNTQSIFHTAISVAGSVPIPGDDADTGAIIRNNSIYLSQPAAGSEGISLRANSGSNLQVVSNVIYYGAGANPTHSCFAHTASSNFTAFANNLCHHAGGNGAWSASYATLAGAKAAGFDTNGLSSDPLWVIPPTSANNWSCQLQSGPATDAGHPTLSSPRDRFGMPRAVPDIGACEN